MSEPVITVGTVVINVLDFERQKEFWGSVLGVEVAREIPPYFVWFTPQQAGGMRIALQAVAEASEGPRRLHLDSVVTNVEAAKARILELGGSHLADREMGGFGWTVMADPEGNEFCLGARD
jgi:predicted enzyme related to lactoylglutathione lyase